jgi:hypothetical protein
MMDYKIGNFMGSKNTSRAAFSVFLLIAIVLAGCAQAPAEIVYVTQEIPYTVVVTQIVERVITATPEPSTPTPEPTETLEATATPAFQVLSIEQVVEAFRSAGLEVENPHPMLREDFGLVPYVAMEATRFLVPSICPDCGGRIFSFANVQDLELTKNYYDELGRQSAMLFSWVFVKDNILVQINGDLPETQAREYENALENLK